MALSKEAEMALDDDQEAALRREFDDTKAALKKANEEAKSYRLTADRFGKQLDEAKEAAERERTDATVARDKERSELTDKLSAAEKAAAERDQVSRNRMKMADLRIAARDAGMNDLDALKMLADDTLKLADDGSVTNAADVIAEMKKAKPYAFGVASASSAAAEPSKPKPGTTPTLFGDMTPDQQTEWKRQQGIIR